MFKLFSKKETPVTKTKVADLPTITKTNYPTVVDEIHNEFFSAGENILQEATCLLQELEQKDLAKGKRLAALGFGNTREAVVAIETENKLATTKEIADLVMYYRVNYPNNKFITEQQVKQICEKYSLICGETSMYKGFVPENKLKIIENFKVNDSDIGIAKAWYDSDPYLSCTFDVNKLPKHYKKEKELKICAPLKDMNIPKGKEVKGYKVQNIPDPVVLQPIRGGYLIVCAWGDEASDEIVVNQNAN